MDVVCNISAAKAAQFCAECRTTMALARELPLLPDATHRMLRAQSLGIALNHLTSSAHFFHGPSVEHLRAYIIDWMASDTECREPGNAADFCAELQSILGHVDAALGEWEDTRNYGVHCYSDAPAGSGAGP